VQQNGNAWFVSDAFCGADKQRHFLQKPWVSQSREEIQVNLRSVELQLILLPTVVLIFYFF